MTPKFPDPKWKSANAQMAELQSDGPWLYCKWEPRPVKPEPTAAELSHQDAWLQAQMHDSD